MRLEHLMYAFLFFSTSIFAQTNTLSSTKDIDHFWEAYDHLAECYTKEDSINSFQSRYLNKASEGFKEFLKVRKFTAKEYYYHVKRSPKFWESIRANSLKIKTMLPELEEVYTAYEEAFPGHEKPKICFAMGCLRTAGTVSEGYLLIGSEMIVTDKNTDKSELGIWEKTVLPIEFTLKEIVAHEYVHALQAFKLPVYWSLLNHRVLFMSLMEGSCDFLAQKIVGATINKHIHNYADANEALVWGNFKQEMWTNKSRNWVYNGGNAPEGVPADLGYYVGYKICESYYEKAEDKQQALNDILKLKNVKKFYEESGYDGGREVTDKESNP
ncbi:MAG: DUF2268 domain-containing putative Zn-dependent protease [Bacteroidota bacterium]